MWIDHLPCDIALFKLGIVRLRTMTQTMVRRTSICLTKETARQLDELKEKFGENTNQVIIRAISYIFMCETKK